jgi:hypothetical protein
VVAHVTVTRSELVVGNHRGEKFTCGQRVVADVVEAFKGRAATVEFVGDGMSYNVGSEYLVFLIPARPRDAPPMSKKDAQRQLEKPGWYEACSSQYSGYFADWTTTSEFLQRWSKEPEKFEPWLTPAYGIAMPADAGLVFRRVELHALRVDDTLMENDFWSWEQGVPMPDVLWMYKGAYEWRSYRKHLLKVASSNR